MMVILVFSQCSKFDVDLRNAAKKLEQVFYFLENCIGLGCSKLSLLRTGILPSAVNVWKYSPKISDIIRRDNLRLNLVHIDEKNMIKVLSWRLQKSFLLFNVLTVEGRSETGLFRYLINHVFHSFLYRKYVSHEGHIFIEKCSKTDLDFRNGAKKWKIALFWDKWIWIGFGKFSLLGREYLSSAVNV